MFGKRFSRALAVATAGTLIMASATFADTISNDLDGFVDADLEVMNLSEGGSTGSVTFRYIETNDDSKSGCNLTGSNSQLNVAVASDDTDVATVSVTSLTFAACGETHSVTVTPVAAGTATVSLAYTSVTTSQGDIDSTDFNLAPASFTVNVAAATPSDTTPPIVLSINRNGSSPTNASSVGWTVTFSESVTSVDAADFSLAATGVTGASVTDVTGTGSIRTVTASTGSGSGSLGLDLVDNDTIVDGANNKLGGTGLGNGNATGEVYAIDKTPPAIGLTTDDDADATAGWFNIASDTDSDGIKLTASATDANGVASLTCTNNLASLISESDPTNPALLSDTKPLPAGTNNVSCLATDGLGNSTGSANATTGAFRVDLTAPSVSLVGGPADGASYYFGSVPAAPTCSASDATPGSGLNGTCSVSGYSSAVGSHTVTASATDNAGNSSSDSASYTVLAWTLTGFYRPVDMGILNTAKAGSTIPLKFEVFAGATELTDTAIVSTFAQKINCASGTGDAIEEYATGSTSLRYDTTGGQFIFNWKTPTTKACYRVTLTTLDGSSIYADFQTK